MAWLAKMSINANTAHPARREPVWQGARDKVLEAELVAAGHCAAGLYEAARPRLKAFARGIAELGWSCKRPSLVEQAASKPRTADAQALGR